MKTHVFIVNEKTLPVHLQYLFAGTGAYNQNRKIWLDEHIGLLSDISRARLGDLVIFYIEGTQKVKGGFYGIFQIAKVSSYPIVFHVPGQDGFRPNLSMKLIYRTLLRPYEVYSKGVPEWEALDKLPVYATDIQWSLIYRKLKGKRGCTPLLPLEAKRLINMIKSKNNGNFIANEDYRDGFNWDNANRRIILTPTSQLYDLPFNQATNPLPIICKEFSTKKRYEIYLQLYFTYTIGVSTSLNPIVGHNVLWFGNEVACGVGMQRIDILAINQLEKEEEYRIVELKDKPIKPDVVEQIEYYVNWASQNSGKHLDSAFAWNMQPVVFAPKIEKKFKKNGEKTRQWQKIVSAFNKCNQKRISLPILYFEFRVDCGGSLVFGQIKY